MIILTSKRTYKIWIKFISNQFVLLPYAVRILTVKKLEDFNFLRGLAPGLLDGFSIETYEKKRESLALSATWFESGAMSFSGRTRSGAGAVQKLIHPCPFIKRKRSGLKILQNCSKYHFREAKFTVGKVTQRLFSTGPCTYFANIYRYR